jgi:hypothetical protein
MVLYLNNKERILVMSVNGIPANQNLLSPLGFKFNIARSPNLSFNVTSFTLPGISLAAIDLSTPFINIPLASTKNIYNAFNVTFKIDEDMNNYIEVYEWLLGLTAAKNFEKYKALSHNTKSHPGSTSVLTSDLNLSIMTSKFNHNISVNFYDAFPIELSDIEFNIADTAVSYLDATATFRYLSYEIIK